MATIAIAVAVIIAAVVSWLGARMLAVRFLGVRMRDDVCASLRKVHVAPTPRIGGIAVALGILCGAAIDAAITPGTMPWVVILICVSPAFVWGLIEDFSSRGAVLPRLVLPAVAAALAFVLMDARLTELDIPVVDRLLTVHTFSFLFTLFAVTGVTHSMNVIDGLNGLAGATAILGAIGLALVAGIVGDSFVFAVASVLAASLAGFLLVNYPSGRIFLGDGGAYMVGLLLAELGVLLVQRNSEVSPWFPPVLLAYPIWETLFSMYRRKMRGHSSAQADALHLHSLVYQRVVRWRGYKGTPEDQTTRNSIASLYLWLLPAMCLVIAVASWNNTFGLQLAAAAFIICYSWGYRTLVRFHVPAWLVLRVKPSLRSLGNGTDGIADAPTKLGH